MMIGLRLNDLLEAFFDVQKGRSGAESFQNENDGIEVCTFGMLFLK